MSPRAKGKKEIASNRKAFHDYFVLDRYEAGIELKGTEVKSLRAGKVNMKDSFCTVKNGELFLHGMHISPYEQGNRYTVESLRPRKLLLHKEEIRKLLGYVQQKGLTLVPLSMYIDQNGRAKIELGVARGKKLYDKREDAAKKDAMRRMDQEQKAHSHY